MTQLILCTTEDGKRHRSRAPGGAIMSAEIEDARRKRLSLPVETYRKSWGLPVIFFLLLA